MLEKDYISKIKDEKIKETMLPIFKFFEPYIDNGYDRKSKKSLEKNFIDEYSHGLKNNNIKQQISSLRKQVSQKESPLLDSFIRSLQKNTSDFISNDKYRNPDKLEKIEYSYLRLSRALPYIDGVEEVIKRQDINKKVLLSLSLVDEEHDRVKANKEVERISQLMEGNSNYVVLPIHGCTKKLFEKIFEEISQIDIIHIAGHAGGSNGNIMLEFVDGNMGFKGFYSATQHHQFSLAFLNCCFTFEFTNCSKMPNASACILHREAVQGDVAYNFVEYFFQVFSINEEIRTSWKFAIYNSNENPRKYLLY
jgi:hypothetical protein